MPRWPKPRTRWLSARLNQILPSLAVPMRSAIDGPPSSATCSGLEHAGVHARPLLALENALADLFRVELEFDIRLAGLHAVPRPAITNHAAARQQMAVGRDLSPPIAHQQTENGEAEPQADRAEPHPLLRGVERRNDVPLGLPAVEEGAHGDGPVPTIEPGAHQFGAARGTQPLLVGSGVDELVVVDLRRDEYPVEFGHPGRRTISLPKGAGSI